MREPAGKSLIVIHHSGCVDGETSRMIVTQAHAALRRKQGGGFDLARDVKNIAYKHYLVAYTEKKILKTVMENPGAEVIFVDVAPRKAFLKKLRKLGLAGSIRVIDHHPGRLEKYGYRPSKRLTPVRVDLDTSRSSAARFVWDLLYPGRKAPPFVNMVDRMDIDAPGLITEKQIAAAAYIDHCYSTCPHTDALKMLKGLSRMPFNEMARRGAPFAAAQEAVIARMLKTMKFAMLPIKAGAPPVAVPLVKGDIRGVGRTISRRLVELAHHHGTGIAGSYFTRDKDDAVTVNFRSDGIPDADRAARSLGRKMRGVRGGGHKRCAAAHFDSVANFERQVPLLTERQVKAAVRATRP